MKLCTTRMAIFSWLALVGASAGCSHNVASQTESDETGSVGLRLTLPGGELVTSLSWQILSGAEVVQSGALALDSGTQASFAVGDLPASFYTIDLSGTSSDGLVTCAGSGTFTIAPRRTTLASVNLQCATAAVDAGAVAVTTTFNDCATWQSVSVTSSEVAAGSTVTLTATATAPNSSAITYQWSAPSGTFGSPTSGMTTFTSGAPGTIPITLVVGDGPVAPGFTCSPNLDTTSVSVTFDPVAPPAMDGGSAAATPGSSLVSVVDPLAGQGGTDNFFYVGQDDDVHALSWSPGLPWSSANINQLVNPPAPTVAGTVLSGHLENSCPPSQSEEVFYLGSDQHVHELWRWSSTAAFDGWHHTDVWAASGATILADARSSLAAIADPSAGADVVFFAGTDGHLYALTFACSATQWAILDLTSKYAAPAAALGSAFAAHLNNVTASTPSEELFYIGADQQVDELWAWSLSTAFDGWHHTIVSSAASAPLASSQSPLATVADTAGGSDVVFYVGADSDIHELALRASSLWTTLDITAEYAAPAVASGSSFVAHLNNSSSNPSEELWYVDSSLNFRELWAWSLNFDGWHNTDVSAVAGGPNPSANSGLATDVDTIANPVLDEAAYVDRNGDVHLLDLSSSMWIQQDISIQNGTPQPIP